jgi:muconate cycloisomerase
MRIERIEVLPVRLPIRGMLTLPRGPSRTEDEGKRIAVVKMTADDGTVGWGEAGPSRRWSAETLESCVSSLRLYLAPVLIGHDPADIEGLHAKMNRELATGMDAGQPVAKAALDIAAHDLACKRRGIPLLQHFAAGPLGRIALSRLISVASPREAEAATREAIAAGYRGFKVKVGTDPKKDFAIVKAVVAAANGGFVWPDANQGFNAADALELARALEPLGITLFEQPVAATDFDGLRALVGRTALKVVLDESAMSLAFVRELARQKLVEGLAVKINKLGGLFHGDRMCALARELGVPLLGSGLMDAPISFMAAVHLFAAYGIDLPVDLNGPQFISEDYLARPLPIEQQDVVVSSAPGLGLAIDEAKLARYALRLE